MIMYGNNEDPSYSHGPEKYNYCRPHTNPDFDSYYSLMQCQLPTVIVMQKN